MCKLLLKLTEDDTAKEDFPPQYDYCTHCPLCVFCV